MWKIVYILFILTLHRSWKTLSMTLCQVGQLSLIKTCLTLVNKIVALGFPYWLYSWVLNIYYIYVTGMLSQSVFLRFLSPYTFNSYSVPYMLSFNVDNLNYTKHYLILSNSAVSKTVFSVILTPHITYCFDILTNCCFCCFLFWVDHTYCCLLGFIAVKYYYLFCICFYLL